MAVDSGEGARTVAARYRIERELGRGGMGIVWQALDLELQRPVAIKEVLLPGHLSDEERADAHARVQRGAQTAARVNHPAVITLHDVFDYDGHPGAYRPPETQEPPGTPSNRNPKGCGNGSQLARERDSLPPHTPDTVSARTPPPPAHHHREPTASAQRQADAQRSTRTSPTQDPLPHPRNRKWRAAAPHGRQYQPLDCEWLQASHGEL